MEGFKQEKTTRDKKIFEDISLMHISYNDLLTNTVVLDKIEILITKQIFKSLKQSVEKEFTIISMKGFKDDELVLMTPRHRVDGYTIRVYNPSEHSKKKYADVNLIMREIDYCFDYNTK